MVRKFVKNLLPYFLVRKYQSRNIDPDAQEKFYFSRKGFCPICNRDTIFFSENSWLRNSFVCTNCESTPRQRAVMLTIEKYYPNWRDLSIHESSPSDCAMARKLRNECKQYIASQYYPSRKMGVYYAWGGGGV
jgi:hypothetical protein